MHDYLILLGTKNTNFENYRQDSTDFVDLNVVRSIPPKIIWIKTGNLTTKAIAEVLKMNIESIKRFLESDQPEHQILEIIKNNQ